MNALICVVLAAIISQEPEKPTGPNVQIVVELSHSNVGLFDPLFVRVSVRNLDEQSTEIPSLAFANSTPKLDGFVHYPYSYHYLSEEIIGQLPSQHTLPPRESLVLNYRSLPFPPLKDFRKDFWHDIIGRHGRLDGRVSLTPAMQRDLQLRYPSGAGASVSVQERPQEEIDFLMELCAEAIKRDKEQRNWDWDGRAPTPSTFGFEIRPDLDLTQKLLDYEDRLSEGTLRDVVHLTKLTQTLYQSRDEAEQVRIVLEIVSWLDNLSDVESPDVEREILCMRILDWMDSHHPDELPYHVLFYEAAQRMPKRAMQFKDYREYRLRDHRAASLPGYKAYLKIQGVQQGTR